MPATAGGTDREVTLNILLRLSRVIDAINNGVGHLTYWLVLVAVIISSGNATVRYVFNTSSNAWLELQWYLFSAIFLLCAGYTFLKNEHIRIDVVVGRFSKRVHAWIDIFGILLFLFPMAVLILVLSWPMVVSSYTIHEMSNNAGGLLRWPVKLLVPAGFGLLVLQGVSELIKRIAFLLGLIDEPGEKMHGHS